LYTLVELILELKRLAAAGDANRLEKINALFSNPRAPAEYHVARVYVASQLQAEVRERLASIDPSDRLVALTTARSVFPRAQAARAVRQVLHDPDRGVRIKARLITGDLHLDQPASPIGGAAVARGAGERVTTLAWAYGIFPTATKTKRKAAAPSRAVAELPKLPNVAAVAKLVGLEPDDLPSLMRAGTGSGSGYVEFEIPKAKGGTRRIAAPRAKLRKVQRTILDHILAKVPQHDASHGFIAGRSTVTNAKPHEGAAIVVKLDLKDFFPTVHYRRVKGVFVQLGYSAPVAGLLAGLTTYRPRLASGVVVWPGVLPQGAPTSPALANLCCRRMDARLAKLADKYGARYTRYADDLTFSFAKQPDVALGRFLWWVDGICHAEGFNERPDKRRILRNKHQQRVTGLVVNAGVHVPRADRKRFRAILHNCEKTGLAEQAKTANKTVAELAAYLAGFAAYVQMVEPALGKRFGAQVEAILAKQGA
jgi:retron-type reverse transcriptase